jgi:hypothetical protein
MLHMPKTEKRRTSWWVIPLLGLVVLTFLIAASRYSLITVDISATQ